jgi:hypothetical protein
VQGVVAQKLRALDGIEWDTTPNAEIENEVSTVAVDGFAEVWVHETPPVADEPCVTVTSLAVPSTSAVTSSAPIAIELIARVKTAVSVTSADQ